LKATHLMVNQHREIESLFGKLLKSDDARIRTLILSDLRSMLEIHMTIEESFFYPAYRLVAGTQRGTDLILEAREEHHVVDLILADLPKSDPMAERFDARLKVLRKFVESHYEREEREIFPDAESKLGREHLEELGARMGERASHLST